MIRANYSGFHKDNTKKGPARAGPYLYMMAPKAGLAKK